ncbi:MAG: hypothetical protein E7317_12515 [Clostridiales bacterium]|nr:hypothetical protein [Clostridiales bacterium]
MQMTANDMGRMRNEPPVRSLLEEIGNAVTHGVGALLSIAGFVLLLLRSDTPAKLLASCFYGICLILLFTMSCLYHAFPQGSTVKRLWRRFDYSSIYLLIGGSFAPLFLVYWGNALGRTLFIVQWAVIVAGITLIGVFGPGRFRRLHLALYVALGWCGLMFLPDTIRNEPGLCAMILSGGVVYTLGIIPFRRHTKGAHFLWHFFVLGGALIQWFGIYLYVY